MSISPANLQEVQNAVHIEEVVADFVPLKKKGQNLWACCPFHQEKTPSFSVSPAKGFYKCFGCGAAGDAITFVQEIEGVSFVEAVKYLGNKYGIEIQESAPDEGQLQHQHEKDSLYILLNLAKEYYVRTLWKHDEGQTVGLSYFHERGLTDPFIKQFELGYSLDAWEGFYRFAREKGYEDELLEKAGLLIRKENKRYDRFRGRVLFPIHNVSGKVIAFGARILKSDKNQPKYINSPETAVYHKSNSLYGLFQAKQRIKQEDNCYLVEGYTDVLALHMAGMANVVASSGTSLTEEQVQLISRFTQNVTMLFDGDPAGIKASLRGVDIVLEKGLNVRVVSLPKGEDPDSYARKAGAAAFQTYLQAEAQDFIQFKATLLMQAAQEDPIRKAGAIKEIVQSIALIPDAVKRAVLTQQCSQLLGIDEAVLTAEQNQVRLQKEQQQVQRAQRSLQAPTTPMAVTPKEAPAPHRLAESITAYERESIRLLLSYGHTPLEDGQPLYVYLLQELEEVHFRTPAYKTILEHFQQQLAQGNVVDATYFIRHEDEALKKAVIDLTASPYDISTHWEERHQIYTAKEEDDLHQTAFKNILRLKLRLIQQLIEENRAGLQNNPAPAEEDKLLQVHTALKESEAAIAQQLGIVVW
ncbi:MAG: DNA primase [Bacteroidota bacterium]